MNLITFLVVWARSLEAWLGSHEIAIAVGESPQNIPKRSAWVTLTCAGSESELILWESGEAEFAHGGPEGEIVQEHHEVATVDDLGRLLSRLLTSTT